MKRYLHKFAYPVAALLLLAGVGLYVLGKPAAAELVASDWFQPSKQKLESVLDRLDVFGFADPLAAQKEGLKAALELFRAADYPASETALKQFLDSYPGHEEAQYYLGMSCLYQNKKMEAVQHLEGLATVDSSAFQEDAQWFVLMATVEKDRGKKLQIIQQLAADPTAKYQQAAAAMLGVMKMNEADFSLTTQQGKGASPEFAFVLQPNAKWWQQPLLRSSLLFLLPMGGIGLIWWKQQMKEWAAETIQEEVATRTAELKTELAAVEKEKQVSEAILDNILPAETKAELKQHGHSQAKRHDTVTVLFCDFKGFTGISEKLSPEELVRYLDIIFEKFDYIIEDKKLEKIKTVGDCYICAGGLKKGNENDAVNVVKAAQEMIAFLNTFNEKQHKNNKPPFAARIGINTGPVVAGIVGIKKYAYDIWGDTVNIAARMEQASEGGRINISGTTYDLVKDHFEFEHRGKVEAKGKGAVDMYFLISD